MGTLGRKIDAGAHYTGEGGYGLFDARHARCASHALDLKLKIYEGGRDGARRGLYGGHSGSPSVSTAPLAIPSHHGRVNGFLTDPEFLLGGGAPSLDLATVGSTMLPSSVNKG